MENHGFRVIGSSVLILLVVLFLVNRAAFGVEEMDRLYRLDLLPRFHESVEIGTVSSYDRTGGNDDGFSGKYSFVREEGDDRVIADLTGPGVIYRIWTPTPMDELVEFYFDGEETPRIQMPFRELFLGKQSPFLQPVVCSGAGGYTSYVPLAYEKSCKVGVRGKGMRFYQINYATYADEARIETYPGPDDVAFMAKIEKARRLLSKVGSDISEHTVRPGTELKTVRRSVELRPGAAATLFETDRGGRIVGLRMTPAGAMVDSMRGVVLKIYWDGSPDPAVNCPLGDFFGYAWGEPAMKSLLLGTTGETNYIYLPMPFDSSARIELVQEDAEATVIEISAEVVLADIARQPNEGRLHAVWRREDPTQSGVPFTMLDVQGRGHLVGTILQAQGSQPGRTSFFEGDDQTTLDGRLAIHGTGSEDLFNGGWYAVPGRWNGRVSLPLSGSLGYDSPAARTGGYRFFLADAYPFRQSILQTIEHGPVGNQLETDYAAVTYFYADADPDYERVAPGIDERKVVGPSQIVYNVSTLASIRSFSWINASITRIAEPVAGRRVKYLRFEVVGQDQFGPHHLALACDLPESGTYRVSIEPIHGPDAAVVQVFRRDQPVGDALDLRQAERRLGELLALGEFDFEKGPNELMLRLVGEADKASPRTLELTKIVFDRVED